MALRDAVFLSLVGMRPETQRGPYRLNRRRVHRDAAGSHLPGPYFTTGGLQPVGSLAPGAMIALAGPQPSVAAFSFLAIAAGPLGVLSHAPALRCAGAFTTEARATKPSSSHAPMLSPHAARRCTLRAMTIRALLFDLGDTLWHFPVPVSQDVLHARCAAQIAPLLDGWDTGADARELSRRLLDEVERATEEAAAGSLISPDFNEVLDRVARDAGLSLDGAQLDALWAAWHVDGARMGRQLYPDTVTTLAWARQEGYRLGLITNRWYGRSLLQRELDGCNLGRAFDCVTVSCDVGWLKPHPEIFYAALSGLGTEAAETVMVGDSLRADIAGARMLGMHAVWKRNGRRRQHQADPTIPPDAMIDDLWELRRVPTLADSASAVTAQRSPTAHEDDNDGWY